MRTGKDKTADKDYQQIFKNGKIIDKQQMIRPRAVNYKGSICFMTSSPQQVLTLKYT